MNITLTKSEKEDLECRHRKERDRRVADRFKAILLSMEKFCDAFCALFLEASSEKATSRVQCS